MFESFHGHLNALCRVMMKLNGLRKLGISDEKESQPEVAQVRPLQVLLLLSPLHQQQGPTQKHQRRRLHNPRISLLHLYSQNKVNAAPRLSTSKKMASGNSFKELVNSPRKWPPLALKKRPEKNQKKSLSNWGPQN